MKNLYTPIFDAMYSNIKETKKISLNLLLKAFCVLLLVLGGNTNVNGQVTALSPTGDGGFETGTTFALNGWTAVNPANSAFWVCGTGATAYAGARGAYIASTGTTYGYTPTVARVAHIYKDVVVPAGATSITLKFWWKGKGEVGYDRLLVYTAPTTVTPVANSPASTGTAIAGATLVYTQPTFPATLAYAQIVTVLPAALAGTTVRLIFTWQNDASLGTSPGAAIDNVELTYISSAACTGTPNAGTATITSATGCPSASFTLNSSGLSTGAGISYLWESSPDNATWTSTGITTSSYTTSTSTTKYYRLKTTCSGSGLTNTSNVVSYTVASSSCACTAYPACNATSAADDEILNVTVGTLNNTSACASLAGGAGSVVAMYSNYSGIVAAPSLMQGSSISSSVTIGFCSGTAYTTGFAVYIDYNQNGVFTDAGEMVYSPNATFTPAVAGTAYPFTFTVPAGATLGTTRMRIVDIESTALPASTGTFTWGETEDYCVTIIAAPPCSGTPSPGNTLTSSASVASGSTVNLTLSTPPVGTGLTYAWQSGPSNTGPWTTIATTATYTATVTANTWYRCLVTCAGSTGTATPVQVTLSACIPVGSTTYYISNFNTVGGVTNIANTTGASAGGYGNYSALSCSQFANSPITFNITETGGTSYFYVWIDWNNNLNFSDAGENVVAYATYAASYSGAYTVPAGTPVGNYRMRVANSYIGIPAVCGPNTWGEYEDYTFSVMAVSPPSISSISPASFCGGGVSVVITGTGFSGTSSVTFNGVAAASYTVNSSTQITAITPSNVTAGVINIVNSAGNANSSAYTIAPLSGPTAVSASPSSICAGATANLNATAASTSISWYTVPTGGTAIGSSTSGVNFPVNPSVNTTYYAESTNNGPSTTILNSPTYTNTSSGNWTLGYKFTPNTNITVTSFRRFFGSKISIWTDAGVLVASQAVTGTDGVWTNNTLATPVVLTAGTTYRIAAYANSSTYYWANGLPATFTNGLINGGVINGGVEVAGDAFPSATDAVGWWFVDLNYYAAGCTSTRTSVTVNIVTPVITSQPTAPSQFCGGSGTSTVSIAATGATTYQWMRNGVAITGAPYSNFMTNTLTITNPSVAENGASITCVVTGAGSCSVTSSSVSLVVGNAPTTPSPVTATNSTICVGQTSQLNATSAGNYINWYTAATGGTLITTVPSATNYGVNPLATTTYYAESVIANAGTPVTQTFGYTGAITTWTVPAGVTSVTINAKGAQGGTSTGTGGLGANMTGTFAVTPGQVLSILAGQQPAVNGYPGGGGGTFVALGASYATATPLIVAGGGSGAQSGAGDNASIGTSGNGPLPGTAGNGAASSSCGGGGGGFFTSGGNDLLYGTAGAAGAGFRQGGAGGISTSGYGPGGFGGGATADYVGSCNVVGGSGGGYSGGSGTGTAYQLFGYGGGSYNAGTSQTNTVGNTGNGIVVITYTPVTTGCASLTRQAVTVTVNSLPTANAGAALTGICVGSTSAAMGGSVGGSATGGTWSGGTGIWTNANNPATATYTAGVSESGIITLTLTTTGGGCTAATVTKSIVVSAAPTVNAGTDATLCPGQTASLGVAPGSLSTSPVSSSAYGTDNTNFTTAVTVSGAISGATITSLTFTPSLDYYGTACSYYSSWYVMQYWNGSSWVNLTCGSSVTINDFNGTVANGLVFTIRVIDLDAYADAVTISINNLVVNYSNPTTYSWSPATNLSSSSVSNPTCSATTTTTYTLTASANGCSSADQVLVTVAAPTLATTPATGDMIWKGATNTDWATLNNWWEYNGSAYVSATGAPTNLKNVIIPANQSCVLNQPNTFANSGNAKDLTIEAGATLTMGNGTLVVNGNWINNNVFVAGTGTVQFEGAINTTIGGSAASNDFYNVIMNKTGEALLVSPATISGSLTLTNGKLNIAGFNIDMASNAINGGSAASYVKTSGSGVLKRDVSGSLKTFPVGNGAYNPAGLTNIGTADNYGVRVIDNVTNDGTGVGTTTSDPAVKRTWMISETSPGGSDVSLQLYWNGVGEEINSFSLANTPYMAHYSAAWDNIGGTVTANVADKSGITSFSPFTIKSTISVLPIELISFQANCAGDKQVDVTWATASEHNTSHFVVEKSRDGLNWTILNTLGAAGNSTTVIEYALTDNDVASGTTYYRLTQFDNDGVSETFNIASVNCGAQQAITSNLVAYPNPSNGSFYIDFYTQDITGPSLISVFDSRGVIIYRQDVLVEKGSNVFHIEDLEAAPGMYYIKVSNGTTTSYIVKHSLR